MLFVTLNKQLERENWARGSFLDFLYFRPIVTNNIRKVLNRQNQ